MLRVALTGGVGTGKSAVLVAFAELGAPVLDADPLADIENTRKIYRVIKGGRLLDPVDILRSAPSQ